MTIIRTYHNRENPYVQLSKKALWDENLSLKAVGLWARCMSRPDNWEFRVSELIDSCKEGKRAIYSAIDELIENNYAVRIQSNGKSEDGNIGFGSVEYIFFEFKVSDEEKKQIIENFKKSLPRCGFAHARFADPHNAPLLNIDSTKEKEETKERDIRTPNARAREKPKINFREFVMLTQEEYNKLLELHSKEKLDMMLDVLNSYKGSTGKKYKSDYHTMTEKGWVTEKVNQQIEEKIQKINQKKSHSKDSKHENFKRNNETSPNRNPPREFKPRFHFTVGDESDKNSQS